MAVASFPIDKAYLIGGWLESFMWGVYTTMFAMTMYTIYQKRREGVNRFTTVALLLLYVLATGHVSLALVRLIQGFILYRDILDPILYFANISVRLNMAKDYLYITNLFLGDLVIVWRLYVVWGNNFYIAFIPFLMCIGELGVGYSSISQWLAPTQNFTVMSRLGSAQFIISLVVNILVTMIIAGRIWFVSRRTRKALGVAGGNYTRVLLLIIESGALVAAAKLTEFTLYELAPVNGLDGLNAMYIVYECMPQITGLAPTCIIYAVNKGFTQQDSAYSSRGQKTTLMFNSPVDSDPTAHTSTTLSTAVFAPSGLQGGAAHAKQYSAEKDPLERLNSSSTSVV
ncbi:uncharacterized protein TRAVEDRAFT_167848 [Trametes versicolor FP-101664 SS1]|uniref:uncharacterized protein n=1 Tax=Trametes versicolor (strain FP-101664) TaxID=717944 RepID=UPI00046224C6|nr:uncharacterized protein TRAVEDRAFT_167848 [Trametes versicolor FP-101664 SS1]EIW58358.1 hypothetical protein TRAVEDRAFT_167848 [Trametes versicolor FP-101664 SS1]